MTINPSCRLVIVLAVAAIFVVVNAAGSSSQVYPTSSVTYNHLKWITNRTQFPVELSVPVSSTSSNNNDEEKKTTYWDWLRLNDNRYVSKLTGDLFKNFLVSETKEKASLVVLNYNNRSHEQLGSYEPQLLTSDGVEAAPGRGGEQVVELGHRASNKRDIFTLAYLKDHYMKSEKFPDRIKVTCMADFLIANTTMTDTIMSLMERYASFKMAVKSVHSRYDGPAPGPRISSHTRNHIRPSDVRRPSADQLRQIQAIHELLQQQQAQQQRQQQQLQQLQEQQQQQQQQQQRQQVQENMREMFEVGSRDMKQLIEKLTNYQQPPLELLQRAQSQQQQVLQQQQQQQQQQLIQQQIQQQLQQQQAINEQIAQKSQDVTTQEQQPKQQPLVQQQQQQQPQRFLIQDQLLLSQSAPQYQQLYHPTHHSLFMIDTPLQPAAYQSDLFKFYSSLLSTPKTTSGGGANTATYSPRNFFTPLSQASAASVPLAQLQQQQQQQQQLIDSVLLGGQALAPSTSLFEYMFGPRLGKREVRSSMIEKNGASSSSDKPDYELDYDESKFLKIRLSLGPISIYRPFDREEVISCNLNLIDPDTLLSEYENKIFEVINTEEYTSQDEYWRRKQEEMDDNARPAKTWIIDAEKPEKNDLMFMIDAKDKDPAVEIKKAFAKKPQQHQEEIMNRVRERPVAELIEMERQLRTLASSSSSSSANRLVNLAIAFVCIIFASFFRF